MPFYMQFTIFTIQPIEIESERENQIRRWKAQDMNMSQIFNRIIQINL